MTVQGVDISNHQLDPIDWAAVRASGVEFCIHKASEGVAFTDRYLVSRWGAMATAGLVRGSYHFARPSLNAALAEADHFVAIMAPLLAVGDSVWLDIEDDGVPIGVNLSAWCLTWLAHVEQRLGVKPGLYTYPSYVTERGLTDPRLGGYPLWWASYQEPMRPAPPPWTVATIWQYTSDASVPGLRGRIDGNLLLADDVSALVALGLPGAAPAPDAGPYDTPDAAYDAYCAEWDDEVAWAGQLVGKAHWYGQEPQPVARTVGDRLLAYDGSYAADATGWALDEWQEDAGGSRHLTVWGEPPPAPEPEPVAP